MNFRDTVYMFKSFTAGLLISSCLSLFFHFGIMFVYNLLPESVFLLSGLSFLCFLVFWINVRFDQMNDVTDVLSRTVAFDFKSSQTGLIHSLVRRLMPVNPYIGVLGTVSGLLLLLWAVPALIIYWIKHPDSPGMSLKAGAYSLSAAAGILYFFLCRDKYPSIADKAAFLAGISLGPWGAFRFIS